MDGQDVVHRYWARRIARDAEGHLDRVYVSQDGLRRVVMELKVGAVRRLCSRPGWPALRESSWRVTFVTESAKPAGM